MTPTHTTKNSKRYRYYVTRFGTGGSHGQPWRIAAGELERAAIKLTAKWLRTSNDRSASALAVQQELAARLARMPTTELRAVLLGHELRFHLLAEQLVLRAGDDTVSRGLPATLVSQGAEKKLELPPNDCVNQVAPNPVLLKLLAQARAAQRMVLHNSDEPTVANYSKRHLWQLLRISWLAPDITSAIVEGRHPVSLTGRRLLRASSLPLDWKEQRKFLGFS